MVIDWLNQHGYSFVPILDGVGHRFIPDGRKNKDGWYIGSENSLHNGRRYVTLKLENHATGEQLYYNELTEMGDVSSVDRELLAKARIEQEEKYKQEKEKRYAEGKAESEKTWDCAEEKDHPYLKRKQIKAHGTRTYGQALAVPVCNETGITGLQLIQEDGSKKFIPGTKKQGSYYKIPAVHKSDAVATADRIQLAIVEGFATGASVHEATGWEVYVAFDAGNLRHVAQVVRRLFPEAGIVICGDNDCATEKNVGGESAAIAAREINATIAIPNSIDGKSLDWNDVHVASGIAEVKAQITAAIASHNEKPGGECSMEEICVDRGEAGDSGDEDADSKEEFVNCLGHEAEDYFYTTNSNKQIVRIPRSGHSSGALLDLQPLEYWWDLFPSKKGVNWTKAASELMSECRKRGIFNPEKVRGVGCWLDNKKLVIHLGNRIIVDDVIIPIGEFRSNFIYELGKETPSPHSNPLTNAECLKLINACTSLKWKHIDSAFYFLGWLAISRLGGALNWRPHLWLTGPSGSGKTTLLEMVVKNVIGDWALNGSGGSTEAGIRQATGKDARPVIIDEAETTNLKSSKRIQSLLEFIRQASSNSDSKIMKGTADQQGMVFKPSCIFMLSSIRVNLSEEQDKNRFTVAELLRNDPNDWPTIQEKINEIKPDWGDRLFSRMIGCFDSFNKNKDLFLGIIAKKHNQRAGEQYAPLLAGYVALLTVGEISDGAANKIVEQTQISNSDHLEIEEDEFECLNHLMAAKISIPDSSGDRTDMTVFELVQKGIAETPTSSEHYRKQLRLIGLRLSKTADSICVASSSSELARFFYNSRWPDGLWSKALRRLKGAAAHKSKFGTGNSLWGTELPIARLFDPNPQNNA